VRLDPKQEIKQMLSTRLMTRDPWHAMDQLFQDAFASVPRRKAPSKIGSKSGSKLRVRDTGEAFELTAPLPGVTEDAVTLTAGDDFITLGAKREVAVPEGYTARRRERTELSWERTFQLPNRIDTTKVEAKLQDGILTVSLPKLAEAKTRTITVRAA